MEKQVPAIEQQVRRAKRYRKVAQRLRDLEILSYVRKTSARRDERARLIDVLGVDETVAAAGLAKHKELQTALNQARYDEYQASMALDERTAAQAKAAAALQEHASAQAAAQAKTAELARQCETLEREVDAAAQAETDADAQLSGSSEELRVSRERRDEALALAETAAAAEAAGTAQWEQAYAALRAVEDKRARAAAAAAESHAASEAASAQWQRLIEAAKRLEAELGGVAETLATVARRSSENERAMTNHVETTAQTLATVKQLEEQLRGARAKLGERRGSRDQTHATAAQVEAKLTALTQLETGLSPGAKAAQVLLQARQAGQASGIVGTVAQHITVAREHNLALDALLADRGADVIVETPADAKGAVALLKAARAPRATVIVLAGLPAAERSGAPLRGRGIVGAAGELVRCDQRLRPVLDDLLSSAIVVESLETALDLAKQHRDRTFATLEGDVVRSGAITTGTTQRPLESTR